MTAESSSWKWIRVAGGDVRDATGNAALALDADYRAHMVHAMAVTPANRVIYHRPELEGSWPHGLETTEWMHPGPVAIVVDAVYRAHLAYSMTIDISSGKLFYARHEGVWPSVWYCIAGYNPILGVSICLDRAGDPVIAFGDGAPHRRLMLARWNKSGGSPVFIVETVCEGEWVGYHPACAFDSNGLLHIVHFCNSAIQPMHSFRDAAGIWHHEKIDIPQSGGYRPALAFLNGDQPVVVYSTAPGTATEASRVRVAARGANGQWTREDLPYHTLAGAMLGVAVDRRGSLHILIHETPDYAIVLLAERDGVWVRETLWPGTGYDGSLCLAFDASDRPVVATSRRKAFWFSDLYHGVRDAPLEAANADLAAGGGTAIPSSPPPPAFKPLNDDSGEDSTWVFQPARGYDEPDSLRP